MYKHSHNIVCEVFHVKELLEFNKKLTPIGNSQHLLIPADRIELAGIDPSKTYKWKITAEEVVDDVQA